MSNAVNIRGIQTDCVCAKNRPREPFIHNCFHKNGLPADLVKNNYVEPDKISQVDLLIQTALPGVQPDR